MLNRLGKIFKFNQRTKKYLIPTFLGLLVTIGFVLANVAKLATIEQMGNLLFDQYQRSEPREYDPNISPVRIIDIDNESLEKLGQWPWPRTTIAKLNDRLANAGAGVIAYDIVFSEPDRTSPENMLDVLRNNPGARGGFDNVTELDGHDKILADSFSKTNVVAAFFFTREYNDKMPKAGGFNWAGAIPKGEITNYNGAITPLPVLAQSIAGRGYVSFDPKGDGIIRSAPLISRIGDKYFRSLSLEALRVVQGAQSITVRSSNGSGEMASLDTENPEVVKIQVGAFEIPTTPEGEIQVHYSRPVPGRYIPAWKVLSDSVPASEWADLIAGHIVFVGTGADGLKDIKATPIRAAEPGVLIHAQITEQVISGQFLKRPYWAVILEFFTILLCGILLSVTLPGLSATRGFILGALIAGLIAYGSWYAFTTHKLLLNPVYPLLAILTLYVLTTLSAFYLTETERSRIRSAFSMYLSPTMVKQVSDDPSLLNLGGVEKEMTILFLDIRSFSKISEGLEPSEITTFLNIFLTPMTDILQAHQATIDKYIGDAIVAFWNAPLDDDQHEKNAADSVLQMQASLRELNETYKNQDKVKWPDDVSVGIGLNTGICCVGNLGSEQRFSYSMIGDAANLASRIEGLTKQYKVSVMIGDATATALKDYAIIEADLIQVVGRETPERIFILVGDENTARSEAFHALTNTHNIFLSTYRSGDWKKAEGLIPTLKKQSALMLIDGYYDVMANRIQDYKKSPPPKNWKGIHVATSK